MRRRHHFLAGLATLALFALSVGSLFVASTYGGDAPAPPVIVRAEIPAGVRDRVRLVDGVPVLHVRGTPYEMGRQHGAALKDQIRFLAKEYCDAMIVRAVGRRNLEEWADAVEKYIPAPYREEMRGLAEGAGMTYREVLLVNTMVDRFQAMMCSTVVANGGATADGDVYFGRNLDFPGRNILHRATVVVVYEPEGGEPLVSVTWPGLIGVLSGMNGHGVCGATMMIHRAKELRPGIPYMIMYREALARARKAADVHTYIAKAKRTCANNFMVVDATGKALVVEWDQDFAVARPATDGTLCSTNYFRSDKLKDVGFPIGKGRYDSLEEFLDRERGHIDLAKVKAVLADVARPWYTNVQSMVFLPRRRTLYVSVGGALPAAKQRFVRLDRELLFGEQAEAER